MTTEGARHVAIITDGNGRWATRRGLPVLEGHRAGAENLRARIRDAAELWVEELIVFAFSTENWTRSEEEVQGLMALIALYIERETPSLHENGVRMRFIGRREEPVPPVVIERMDWAEELTRDNDLITLVIPLNYGGRSEIVDAGWPGGAVAIGALGIEVAPRASPSAVASAVASIVGGRSGLRTETAAERLQRQRAASHAGLSRLGQIAALVLISSVLAMAASMAGLVWQRRPAFAALKVHGFGEGELWRALMLEAALLLGAGCLLGGLFGLGGQLLLDRALVTITGFPLVYEVAASAALAVMTSVAAAAVAVLALPGRLAVRVPAEVGLAD